MKYCELVEVNQEFQSSVNLEYDLNKLEKIRGYIPTEQSVRILGIFLRSYYYSSDSQDRATVLIGPYGRGKSHLLLVLSALTSLDSLAENDIKREEAKHILYELCKKISLVNKEVGALAKIIVESNTRTLPVIINSNTDDINQAFLVAISDALKRAGLEGLLPDTYFDSALAVIDKWKKAYPEAIDKLNGELKKSKASLEDLEIGLHQFNRKAYQLFCKCYPNIAAGTDFNPLTNMDVVKLYLAVANALKEQTPFTGISVVFDEFSKFLEANLDKSKMLNFKIIQDLAEAAARSKETQLHFTCITHKDILDYSSSDSFKTVEGRFRKIRFVSSSEQSYELIANAIIKKPSFNGFVTEHRKLFQTIGDRSAMIKVFADLTTDAFEHKLLLGCFPLAPLSAYALLHVSELVGQNERTLFTFLAQSDNCTLKSFIDSDHKEYQWITVDYIYDYFEELFKKEVFNTTVHSVWAKTDSAIRQVSDPDQLHILKAIAIINIIADERLKPVPAHIKAAILIEDEPFDQAISVLMRDHVIAQRESSEFVLLTANGIDVQKSVDQYVDTSLSKINVCETLSKAFDLGFVLPRAYNDRFGMYRCFKNLYMEASTFVSYKNANQILSDYPYDGVVIYLVIKNKNEIDNVNKKIAAFSCNPQIVVCLSTYPFTIERLLKQYEAAGRLLERENDPHFIEELEVLIEDIQNRIESAVSVMFSPSSEYSTFISYKGKLDISKQAELNHAISDICSECFSMTPVINNEMVNKTTLNAQNTKARDLVVSWILKHGEDNYIPCMDGYGPEVSIFKSAFKKTGLDTSSQVSDEGMNNVLTTITEFIQSSEKHKSNFRTLFQRLYAPPFGIRKGVIPLFLSYALRPFLGNIVLYFKGKEIELTATTLSNLNESPENYEILVETGTQERNKYLDDLQELFIKYSDNKSPSINRVYSIVKSMQNWMRSLPEYTKKHQYYYENGEQKAASIQTNVIRSELMKFEINSRELLFIAFPQRLSDNGQLHQCYKTIEEIKSALDVHLPHYKTELTKKLTAMFVPGYQGGLPRAIMSWYENLQDYKKTHVFDSNANAVLSIASSVNSYDDEAVLNVLISSLVAISIEDWNDELAETFIKSVSEAITRINDYTVSELSGERNGQLTISINGVQIEKTFSAETITPLGKTALNNLQSVLEEYNEALEPDEQLAILARLISTIIE